MTFLHDLLNDQAAVAPDETAAVYGSRSSTYGQLDAAASRVAAGLHRLGVRAGSRVGLHMSRSLDLLPALFGLLRSGGICVPVDPEDPAARRATILEHSGAGVVITERALLSAQYPAGLELLAIEDLLAGSDQPIEDIPLDEDALAFVFYTSGSTGTPKGVMLSHRALLSGQRWLQATFPLERGDASLLRTTLSITNLIREVFWPMLCGGPIVIVPPGGHRDPDQLVEIIDRYRVSTLMVVPALLSGMIENPVFAANTSLKYVFCSSDVMPGTLPAAFFATGHPARLFNVYGLTEALYCSFWECLPGVEYEGFVPVGYPAELAAHVLNDQFGAVPDGQTGELCMSGVGIADGYDRLPELNAEKFAVTDAGRVFRTGDLARRAADGRLELLGRMDDQVKIAGHRVELGEVQARLLNVPGITGAVVTGRRDATGHQRLIAYLTSPGRPPSAMDVRTHLTHRLPEYMIPSVFVVVDRIPLTHNGKVDRQVLEDAEDVLLELEEDYVAPRTEPEVYLTKLWAETLSLPRVGIRDNFFALGGDSIQGFTISARARRDGLGLSATQVFATPTVAEMARVLDHQSPTAEPLAGQIARIPVPAQDVAVVRQQAADPAGIETMYPLTQMQQGMLFHSLLDPEAGVYFEQFLYRIDGELDLNAYRRAWQCVVDRHEILRAWINTRGVAEPVQVVQQHAHMEWTVLDWSGEEPAEQSAMLKAYLNQDRRRGFPLERAPLMRLTLIRSRPTEFRLLMSYHHLILDAWSLFILLRESLRIYQSEREGRAPDLRPTRSFGDYVAFLEQEDSAAARSYWRQRLAGFREATVIGESTRLGLSASPQEMHAEARLNLGRDLTERLTQYGRASRLTLNTLVQGAWGMVVAGMSGRCDVCFGITITHRPVVLTGVEDIVGIFINTLPMRVDVTPGQSIGSWLQHVQRTQVAARAHEHYPLPLIQQDTNLPSGQPLFESLLIFENFLRGSGWTGRGGLEVRQERYVGWTNYPLAIEAMPGEELYFQVKYDLAFFDEELVGNVLAAFRKVLEAVADGGTQTVGTLVEAVARRRGRPPAKQRPGPAFASRGSAKVAQVQAVPTTEDEVLLAAIWRQVLGLAAVDTQTPFLALGGSSLAAMQVVALAQDAGIDIELARLFRPSGTIRQLAALDGVAR